MLQFNLTNETYHETFSRSLEPAKKIEKKGSENVSKEVDFSKFSSPGKGYIPAQTLMQKSY